MQFAAEQSGFADQTYGPIDPVVAASATGRAPLGFEINTATGQNVTARQTVVNAPTASLWNPRDGVLPWLAILGVGFVVLQSQLNK